MLFIEKLLKENNIDIADIAKLLNMSILSTQKRISGLLCFDLADLFKIKQYLVRKQIISDDIFIGELVSNLTLKN